MKQIKRLASLILAMVMVFAMSATVFASALPGEGDSGDGSEGTGTTETAITHEYEIYQIFTGDWDEKTKTLSNIRWGQNGIGIQGDKVPQTVLDELVKVKDDPSDTKKLDVIKQYAKLPTTAEEDGSPIRSGSGTEYENLAQGYYLVMDKIGSLDAYNDAAYTLYVVEVVDGILGFNPKADVPHGDKQTYVVNPDGSFAPADGNYGTIGSHVSYVITSEVPDHANFDYYYFIMNDTLDKGLVFDGAQTVTVKVGDKTLVNEEDNMKYYVYEGADATPYSFRLAFDNIKEYTKGDKIVVTYSATVTSDVEKIGVEGNANTWRLQYSNNPNESYDRGTTEDKNKPGLPLEESGVTLGTTPEAKTLTYLTQLDITKRADDEINGRLLAGAEFTLTGTSKQVVLSKVEYFREATEADKGATKYWKLIATEDGKEQYTTKEPTGTKYEPIGVGTKDTKTGYLNYGTDDAPVYRVPEDVKEYEGKTVYKLVKGTAANYADVNVTYVKDTKKETSVVDVDVAIEMTTGEEGVISFKGIGAGTYILTETVTPAGFNTLDPITITVDWKLDPNKVDVGDETCVWTMTANEESGLVITQGTTNDEPNGKFAATVVNKSGSLLPSTGGIGTTIFYVVGAILVIGAGVLLVVRKRMSKLQ